MSISAADVKALREKTGVGMMTCKKALQEAGGDMAGAEKLLRKKGAATAAKKADRVAGEGLIYSYIHSGDKIGVLLEINCETDFTARNDEFRQLARNVSMHIAAAGPRFLNRDEVSEEILADEREIARAQAEKAGKPENIVEKIVQGKMEKYYSENALLEQPFVRDPDMTIAELIQAAVAKIGENIQVRRYARFVLGGD